MNAPLLPSDVAEDREAVRRHGLAEFVRLAWHQVDPSPLIWSWHLDAMCEHLEAVARREIRDLVINLPPGLSKSRVASVLFPSWVWALDPERRFLCASYSGDVVLRDARKMRTLVEGNWYRERWPGVRIPRDETASTAAALFENTRKGFRKSETVRGQWTGEHGDDCIVDDPLDPMGATSTVEIDTVLEWWNGTMPTRFRDHSKSTRACVMQRLHVRDLSAEFIRQGATVLCLPMRYEKAHPHRYAKDPRTVDGELLCPARVSEAEATKLAERLGPTRAAGQLQQRPVAASGSIIRAAWMRRFWVEFPKLDAWALSADCAFKGKDSSDPVALQVWGSCGASQFLIDRRTETMSFTATLRAIKAMCIKWPRIQRKLVEDKANGTAVVDVLKTEVPGLILVNPGTDSKEGRAHAVTYLFEAGNVILPHPELAQYPDGSRGAVWLRGGVHDLSQEAKEGSYEHTLVFFPKAGVDDDVDATTQYLNETSGSYIARLKAAFAGSK